MKYGQTLGLLTLAALMTGCGTSPPRSPEDICEIFREKSDWYDAAQVTQKRWGVPIQVPFAIMYQESGYRYDAKTPRKYLLWVIPWGRVSTASGYAQAKDEVWADYQKSTGRNWADREDFDDAIDFIGWYMDKTTSINGVYKYDAYNQYLNYHEGWGGFRNKTYASKAWLPPTARKVQVRSDTYARQYAGCKEDLNRGFWSRFWHWL
ncbi:MULTISPECIES: transglycosylase SLT domain-containing protein [Pseudomonas]|uniref:Transglycosylase SLT domain-containing protein n=1 Tax=Pseudomonas retamae TaxID=702110 RepID=A0ABW7D7S1_9PSED